MSIHLFYIFNTGGNHMLKIYYNICCGIDNNCKDVCMESTRKYWIPIFNILEDSCNVTITHPKYVKAIQRQKN